MQQHYLLQMLLKHFEDREHPGCVWLYRRGSEPVLVGIANVAKERNMYTFKAPGGDPTDDVEQIFARLEGHTAPLLERINAAAGSVEFSPKEKHTLAWFTAYQSARTPGKRRAYRDMTLQIAKDVAESLGGEFYDPRGSEPREGVSLKLAMLRALDQAKPLADVLLHKHLEVLRAAEMPLIVSDMPVSFVDPPLSVIAPDFLEVFLPVGTHAALLWLDKEVTTVDVERVTATSRVLPTRNVEAINRTTIRHAEDAVFCTQRNESIRALLDQTERFARFTVDTL